MSTDTQTLTYEAPKLVELGSVVDLTQESVDFAGSVIADSAL